MQQQIRSVMAAVAASIAINSDTQKPLIFNHLHSYDSNGSIVYFQYVFLCKVLSFDDRSNGRFCCKENKIL